jgi:hypothetical protein
LADQAAAAASTGDFTGDEARAKLIFAEESARVASEAVINTLNSMKTAEETVQKLQVAESHRARAQEELEQAIAAAEMRQQKEKTDESMRRFGELTRSARAAWILHTPKTESAIRQRQALLKWFDAVLPLLELRRILEYPPWRSEAEHVLAQLQSVDTDELEINEALGNLLRRIQLEAGDYFFRGDLKPITSLITEFDELAVAQRQAAALKRIETAARQATSAAESAKRAAGAAGDAALTGHFGSYASKEYLRSYMYLGGAILSLLGALAGAAIVLWGDRTSGIGWHEALKALVSLPILGLAYYLSRESSAHSEAARRAHEIEVRLQTIEAFTEVMPEVQRQELRGTLGKLIYSRTDFSMPDAVNNLGKEATETIDALKAVVATASKEIAELKKGE